MTFAEFADQYYESYAKINKKSFISDWYMLKQLKNQWGAYDIRQINPLLIESFRSFRTRTDEEHDQQIPGSSGQDDEPGD